MRALKYSFGLWILIFTAQPIFAHLQNQVTGGKIVFCDRLEAERASDVNSLWAFTCQHKKKFGVTCVVGLLVYIFYKE